MPPSGVFPEVKRDSFSAACAPASGAWTTKWPVPGTTNRVAHVRSKPEQNMDLYSRLSFKFGFYFLE